ncbi:MAG: SDR family NAD(P)-dependent oxidoreductase [Clostridiales bacterium]|jgi:short-subunit dehydrogenase|nr:SDR family NAD(P)-dependent oxidoreductase [Clostridiales bacterium]
METQKNVLIVGASSGIGFRTAVKLCDGGYKVYNASRTECADTRVTNLLTDVRNGDGIKRTVSEILRTDGRVDAFVYCAGFSMAAPVEFTEPDDYYKTFEVNFFGAVRCLQQILPSMRARGGGRIVLISSMGASLPIAFDAFYSSAKAALEKLAGALSIELMPYNIKVTALLPGGTATDFTFKRKVYDGAGVGDYAERMNTAVKALAKTEQSGMSPEAVADTIVKIIEDSDPPETVASGFANKAARFSQKILPQKLTSYLNRRSYGQP